LDSNGDFDLFLDGDEDDDAYVLSVCDSDGYAHRNKRMPR
jgi:hypothetical protein